MHTVSLHIAVLTSRLPGHPIIERRKLKAKGLDDCLPIPFHQLREPVSKARRGLTPDSKGF